MKNKPFSYHLDAPLPDRLAFISPKHKLYEKSEWIVFTPRYSPEDSSGKLDNC